MRHRVDHRKLNVTTKHRRALLRNLAIALIEHGSIETTVAKAKEARRFAERLVTIAKRAAAAPPDQPALRLRYLRLLVSRLNNRRAAEKLISEIAPRYRDRAGGYTRVLRAGYRLGDRAPKAVFQFV